ncbi:MAG: hypothetical protein D6785_14765, partial [Planctomycetota bacterium]
QKLGTFLPKSGPKRMEPERLERLENALKAIQQWENKLFEMDPIIIISKELEEWGWKEHLKNLPYKKAPSGKVCQKGKEVFEARLQEFSEFLKTLRIAELELEDGYIPEVHQPYFESFDWRNLNHEEWQVIPPTLVITDEELFLEEEWPKFWEILKTGMPLRFMIHRLYPSPKNSNISESGDFLFRQDLTSIALGQRNVYLSQTTLANPVHLAKSLEEGLNRPLSSLFYIQSFEESDMFMPPFLFLGSSMEGRDFPLLRYDPEKGREWGSRFQIEENPSPGEDWPVYKIIVEQKEEKRELELPFTFADFAVLEPAFQDQLYWLEENYVNENLLSLHEFLGLSEEERRGKLPFVYGV